MKKAPSTSRGALREVALVFLKLGAVGFGGPAAHIALMHREVVRRRGWVSEGEFLDLVGAVNLIPGPNSTELAIHLGYRRAGWPGLVVAGACFILPAFLAVLGCAWAYVRYGRLPQVASLLYGVKPAVVALVALAVWGLGRSALKNRLTQGVAAAVLALWWLGVHELALLLASGLVVAVVRGHSAGVVALVAASVPAAAAASPFQLSTLFFTFLKIGSVLFGSGYVLLAFLHADLVVRLGWLTDAQLLDAVAVGQVTPGPVFTTATFVGYVLDGFRGAAAATAGIFLPAFVFVALSHPLLPRLRAWPVASSFLDGVVAASWALMAGVAVRLAAGSVVDGFTAAVALVALGLFWRGVNSAAVVLGAALAGVLVRGL